MNTILVVTTILSTIGLPGRSSYHGGSSRLGPFEFVLPWGVSIILPVPTNSGPHFEAPDPWEEVGSDPCHAQPIRILRVDGLLLTGLLRLGPDV